jgi:hypothetical protein
VLEKPSYLPAAFAFSAIQGGRQATGGLSPFFFPPGVSAALPFSSIHCGIHTGKTPAPVFAATPVLIHMSESEKRLIHRRRLLVNSVNRFHMALSPLTRS